MNPIQAIVKGTKDTVAQAAGGMYQQIRSTIPSFSNTVYRMGIVGPLAQNIASQMGDKKTTASPRADQEDSGNAPQQVANAVSSLSRQMKSMVSLLADIKMIGMAQLNAVQRMAVERQRALFQAEEAQMEGALQRPGAAATPTAKADKKDNEGFFGSVLKMVGNMPFWVQLLGAALVGKGIWNMLDQQTKDSLRAAAGEMFTSILGPLLKSVFSFVTDNPAFTAGLAALLMPGLTSKALIGISKFMFPGGAVAKAAASTAGQAGLAATGIGATAAAASQVPPKASSPTIGGDKIKPSQRYGGGAQEYLATLARGQQPPAPTVVPEVSQSSKATGILGKLGPMLGKILGPISAIMSGKEAYDQAKEGNMLSSGLHGASAAMALGALVPSPASPFLFAGSVLTGLIGSLFGGEKKKQAASNPNVQGQMPATGTGSAPSPFAGLKMGSSSQASERIGGGATALGVVDLAQKIQSSISGIKEFTAFNDEFHQKNTPYASKHKEGLAMDFTVSDPNSSGQVSQHVRKLLADMGLKEGQFEVRDEYKNPSDKSTAGHIHVQLKDVETANKVAMELGRSRDQLAAASFVGPRGTMLAANQVATPDASTAGPIADATTAVADALRAMMSGGGNAGGTTLINSTNVGGGGGQASASVATPASADHVQYLQNARHVATG